MNKVQYILRWIGVLPASLISVVLITFPLHWFVLLATGSDPEGNLRIPFGFFEPRELEIGLQAITSPLAFIYGGTFVAPQHKKRVALLLTVLMAILLIALHAYLPAENYQTLYLRGWLGKALNMTLNVMGLVAGYLSAQRLAVGGEER